jgi:AcrR family transcriptional regulator
MSDAVKRRYDNSRRLAQVRASRLRAIEAAKALFIESGYPATTLESVAEAADMSLPTLYRLFGSKRALLAAVLDTSFGGDDEPVPFSDRPAVRAARSEPDPIRMVEGFGRILGELMERTSAILYILDTAAQLDPEASELLAEIRRQRHTGQSRIVAALVERHALDPDLDPSKAADMVYAFMSPDVHRILTVERGWAPQDYEAWVIRCLRSLLRNEPPSPTTVAASKKVKT